ncbi:magnesium transporter [Geodermatophilus sp. TF02-6]|uniref:magnesium transporter CorA family protein n=1 Tax=Geodermatophilus sp. TF02-6 TaxID=2250575 RepID=UPI000DE8EAAF|nr:magnesium transporter CorA family protein [Geodermatophilus sp. TF02-6]RBY83723.1 magnesium transporter [Geodermatophilus sp. TF02-6]
MDVRVVTPDGVEHHGPDDLPDLLARDDGVLWVDVPQGDPDAVKVLERVFGFHARAVQDCLQRNPVPKVHVYPGSVFVVLHGPELGQRGHVHYVELDQFVGPRFLVTVHGPVNPAVDPAAAHRETDAVAARVDSGRFRPASGAELSTAVVSALAVRMRDHLSRQTTDVWRYEQQVTAGELGDPERFLDGMFRVRHGLLAVRTMASLNGEVYGRMHALAAFGPDGQPLLENSADQFHRLATMGQTQEDYLRGVIEFYQARTNTKMTIAAERLAVIAAVTLPITALSGVLGMNVIVSSTTHLAFLAVIVAVMVAMSALLLLWTRRQGWW